MDHLSTVCFCVNTELEAELGLNIQSYEDLLDPKLEGKIIFSDPNSSSAAWNNVSNIMAVYGNDSEEAWTYIEGLMKNLVIAGSSSACFKSVQQGEYVVGLTYEDGASTLLKDGATNIKMVYPSEGSSAFAFAAAIVKNAPHMDAAKAMIEWLQSAEGQSYRANYVGTVRFTNENVVVEQSWLPESDTIHWVTRDIDWLIANKTAMLDKWSELYSQYNGMSIPPAKPCTENAPASERTPGRSAFGSMALLPEPGEGDGGQGEGAGEEGEERIPGLRAGRRGPGGGRARRRGPREGPGPGRPW